MSRIIAKILFLICFTSTVLNLNAQQSKNEINEAFKNGNAEQLGLYLSNPVEVFLVNNGELTSRSEAVKNITSFFSDTEPITFRLLHQGGKEQYRYYIGNLITEHGEFRVWYLLKSEKAHASITQLRIERK